MYEIVLRRDDEDDVRMTDQPIHVGQRLEIDLQTWQVVSEEPPQNPAANSRFVVTRFANQNANPS